MAKVYVKNGDLYKALKRFKRYVERESIVKDYKDRTSYKSKKDRQREKAFKKSKQINK